jgi:hypothetical protein
VGTYQRPAIQKDTYLIRKYNCWGEFLGSRTAVDSRTTKISFDIDNPNLSDDTVDQSFLAPPMTDDEAKTAMKAAEDNCKNASSATTFIDAN